MAKKVAAAEPVEGRWALPDGWSWHRVKDIAKIVGGSTPKNAADSTNYSEDGTPWLTPADLSGYSKSTIGQGRRNLAPHVVNRSALLPTGAVLISSRAPVGYCAVASNPMVTNQGFRSLIPADHLDPFFVRYYVLFSRKYLEDHASGTTFKELSGGSLGDLVFPVPPLRVQRQIVACIDELFAEIDDGEAALARARDDLATWRKALLKAAVTGELTADWRAANPAAETGADLFVQTVAERRKRSEVRPRGRKETDSQDLDGAPGGGNTLPEGWAWARIGDLFEVFVGATPSRSDSALWNGDVPWVSSGEVGFCRISDTREKISRAALRGSAGRLHPPGTVMLGMIGEGKTRGQVAILDIEAAHNQNCASIRVSDTPIPPEYIYLVLAEQYERTRMSSSGGNQPALNKERVKAIRIALPGISECRAIATIYDEASHAINVFEEDRILLDASIATLRQTILAAAFRGELA